MARSRLTAGVAGLAMAVLAAASAPAQEQPPPPAPAPGPAAVVERVAGEDRAATAAALALRAFPGGAPVVHVASGDQFADALAGAPAAAVAGGPVLLVTQTTVPAATSEALTTLQPGAIVVLGGPAAVGEEVAAALGAGGATVTRLAGSDRFGTAAAAAAAAYPEGAATVVVASGADFADALSGGALAARLDAPVLLVGPDAVPPATAAELERLAPARVVLVGGVGAVPASVAAGVEQAAGAPVERVAGATRYETAVAAADLGFPAGAATVLLATGERFADAVAGAAAAGALDAPVLLSSGREPPGTVSEAVVRLAPAGVVILGGRAALSENVAAMASEALGVAGDGHRGDDLLEPQDLHLVMDPALLDELYARHPYADPPLPAALGRSAQGLLAALEVEFRGNTARFLPKKSFDLNLEDDQPYLFGSDRMNANAMWTDPSMLRERLAFGAFHDIGHVAPRTRHFDLWINDVYEGLYTHIERIDDAMIEHHGLNPEATLVRDELREVYQQLGLPDRKSMFGYDLSTVADPQALLRQVFSDRSEGESDFLALEELLRWVHATPPGEAFAAGLAQRFDVANLVDWIAVQSIIGDVDAYGDDYWLYYDHTVPGSRWQVIPWDKDLTFGSHFRSEIGTANDYFAYEYDLEPVWENDLVRKLLATDSLRLLVHDRILRLLEGPLAPEVFQERVATIAGVIADDVAIGPGPGRFVRGPQQHHGVLGLHHLRVDAIADFVELRAAYLRRVIQASGGSAYRAEVDLTGLPPGTRVLFTDVNGFTIGALDVTANEGASTVALTVLSEPGSGVNRRYVLDSPGGAVAGDLSLRFRNEIESVGGAPNENWYATRDAVGNQGALVMTHDGTPLPSRPNPFSDEVTATVSVPAGQATFRLTHG